MRETKYKNSILPGLIICLAIYVVGVVAYAAYAAHESETRAMRAVDQRLLLAAKSLKYTLAKDFHDRAIDPDSISLQEVDRNRLLYSSYVAETEFIYFYTVVKRGEGYFFSTATVTPDEFKERRNWYFYPYESIPPEFQKALGGTKPIFAQYKDEWGEFRSVALPERSPNGRPYLACADLDISCLDGIYRRIYLERTLIGLGLFLLTTPFILLFKTTSDRYANQLLKLNRELEHNQSHMEQLIASRTADLLEAKETAEEANRLKSAFLANISHDMRTPLNGIIGFAEKISDSPQDRQAGRWAGIVLDQGRHLLAMINRLLEHTRIIAGQVKPQEEVIDVLRLLRAVAEGNLPMAEKKGLELKLDAKLDGCDYLVGDPSLIKQIMDNLLANAIKFTLHGAVSISLSTRSNTAGQTILRCRVSDTGIGLDQDEQLRIFERFTQFDNDANRKGSGTGLGSTIARDLARLMGGDLWVQSAGRGRGSTFWFDLPMDVSTLPPEKTEKDLSPEKATWALPALSGKVLLVDDDQVNLELLGGNLAEMGLTVDTAQDGKQALDRLAEKTYDLVLMDMRMPVLDGISTMSAIRDKPGPNSDTPVIGMSANADQQQRQLALACGMRQMLTKPVRSNQLRLIAMEFLEDGRELPVSHAKEPEQAQEQVLVPSLEEPMDWALAMSEFQNNSLLLIRVGSSFCIKGLAALDRYLKKPDEVDCRYLSEWAHGLKGGAANLNADLLSTMAAVVELEAKNQRVTKALAALEPLQAELERLQDFLLLKKDGNP